MKNRTNSQVLREADEQWIVDSMNVNSMHVLMSEIRNENVNGVSEIEEIGSSDWFKYYPPKFKTMK